MADSNNCSQGKKHSSGKFFMTILPFIVGFGLALGFGWIIFPNLMFEKVTQPVYFNHKIHIENAGLTCADCHFFREDGSFAGMPKLENCSSCHSDPDNLLSAEPSDPQSQKERDAEIELINNYVLNEKQIPWVAHQKQPDNVFFSHAAHFEKCFTCHSSDNPNMKEELQFGSTTDPAKLCATCHPTLEQLDANIPVEINILTGYSRTTMKMDQCERCHAHPEHFSDHGNGVTDANNACYTCHK